MLICKEGDIFEQQVEAIVNPVNCVGVMGKGLALEFKKRYPKNFLDYKIHCDCNRLDEGLLHVYRENGMIIVNFPTKYHWRDKSNLSTIVTGLINLRIWIIENNIQSIAIPKLGCGLGGLSWDNVFVQIEVILRGLNAKIIVLI